MKLVYVNAYDRNRAYGGSEEGGWWFETGHLLGSIPVMIGDLPRTADQDDKAIEEAKLTLHQLYDASYSGRNNKDISSVNCEGVLQMYVEDTPGADFPTEQPHYE